MQHSSRHECKCACNEDSPGLESDHGVVMRFDIPAAGGKVSSGYAKKGEKNVNIYCYTREPC